MGIFDQLRRMQSYFQDGDEARFESDFRSFCHSISPELADRIASVDLSAYQEELRIGLEEAVDRARALHSKAVYFEYDMDNSWQSAFYLCNDYSPQTAGDDDWSADWDDATDGPDLPDFAQIYSECGFDRDDRAVGSTLFLVARTVSVFVDALWTVDSYNLPICIGFHDQDPVIRIRE